MTTREHVIRILSDGFFSERDVRERLEEIGFLVSKARIYVVIYKIQKTHNIIERKEKRFGRMVSLYHIGPHTTHDASCSG